MTVMIFYLVVLLANIGLLFYFSGIKEGILRLLMILIIALLWLSVESIIENKYVNRVSIILLFISSSLIIVFLWIRKKFVLEEKLNNKKNKKME